MRIAGAIFVFGVAVLTSLSCRHAAPARPPSEAKAQSRPEPGGVTVTASAPAVAESITVAGASPRPVVGGVVGGVTGGMVGTAVHSQRVATHTARSHGEPIAAEEYFQPSESGFVDTAKNPLSTFSIDVDRASYSNVRRMIRSGVRPPSAAVRIEELLNYFPFDYPDAPGDGPFTVTSETAECPWNRVNRLVRIGIQGRRSPLSTAVPNNLVFLIDVSGSMDRPDRLPLVKSAFRLLTEELRGQDTVAIVVYAGRAGLVLPPTPGSDKQTILEALDRLEAGGSTAGGQGILEAYRVAREGFLTNGNNRVILATDGDFNVGVSSPQELERLIEEKRSEGVFLTVLGFGTGNLKDSRMELLADKGNGNYAYIDSLFEARKVLVEEMGGTLLTIAKDVKLQVEFDPAKVAAYRLIGYDNRRLRNEEFADDRKDAGELGSGHSVTALYEVVPRGRSVGRLAKLSLRYKEPNSSDSRLITTSIRDDGKSIRQATEDFRFAAAVAELGLLLRQSEHKGQASFDRVLRSARLAQGVDLNRYREDFIRLAEQARDLYPAESTPQQ